MARIPPRGRIGTGIIHQGHLYGVRGNGIIDCLSLETGDELWAERQPGAGANSPNWASLVRVGDLLYSINQGGDTLVVKAAPRFEIVSVNPLSTANRQEMCNASLAFAHGDIFIRTWGFLWCISTSSVPARSGPAPAIASATTNRPPPTPSVASPAAMAPRKTPPALPRAVSLALPRPLPHDRHRGGPGRLVLPDGLGAELPWLNLALPLVVIGLLFGLLASEHHVLWSLLTAGIS